MNVRIRSIQLAVIIALGLVCALSAAGSIQLHGSGTPPPDPVTLCTGASQVFTVDAAGSNLTYQWMLGAVPATGAGATTASYTATEAGSYTVVVTGDCGEATSAAGVVTMKVTTVIASVAAAKALIGDKDVTLSGPVVTRSFGSFFYVEDANRAAGIKVITSGTAPAEGSAPVICATLRTVNGERVLDSAFYSGTATGVIPDALGMNNRAAAETLPWGLLVRVWGTASVPVGATDTFTISDGSPTPITVKLYGIALPADGAFVIYTGALGAGQTVYVN